MLSMVIIHDITNVGCFLLMGATIVPTYLIHKVVDQETTYGKHDCDDHLVFCSKDLRMVTMTA